MKNLFFLVLLIIIFGFMQNTYLLMIDGIKPNILLVVLTILVPIVPSFFEYLILVLVSGIVLRSGGAFNADFFAFEAIVITSYLVYRYLLWSRPLNSLILVVLSSFLFYLLTDPLFLYSYYNIVLVEAIYNLILGFGLFIILISGHGFRNKISTASSF